MHLGFLLLAGLTGSLMAIQGTLNAYIGKTLGLLPATFSVQLLGALTAGGLLIFFSPDTICWKKLSTVPIYFWLGGPLGVAITYGVAVSIPKLGVGNATTGIIFFQLFTAYLINQFGVFSQEKTVFTAGKIIGILLMVGGAYLLLKKN